MVDLVEDDNGEELEGSNGSMKRSRASTDPQVNASKKVRSDSDSDVSDELLVEGCGVAEVNGTYKRNGDCLGAPQYSNNWQWKGEYVEIAIQPEVYKWYIFVFETVLLSSTVQTTVSE